MKTHLRKRALLPRNPMHLFRILNEIWNSLPNSYFESLVASMFNRSKIVRENKGGSTKY